MKKLTDEERALVNSFRSHKSMADVKNRIHEATAQALGMTLDAYRLRLELHKSDPMIAKFLDNIEKIRNGEIDRPAIDSPMMDQMIDRRYIPIALYDKKYKMYDLVQKAVDAILEAK